MLRSVDESQSRNRLSLSRLWGEARCLLCHENAQYDLASATIALSESRAAKDETMKTIRH
jgi:hypothetical protein